MGRTRRPVAGQRRSRRRSVHPWAERGSDLDGAPSLTGAFLLVPLATTAAILSAPRVASAATDPAAGRLVDIFDRFCLPHLGRADIVRHEAEVARLPTVSPSSPEAMLARPGLVFVAGHGTFLLTLDNGLCGVMGDGVDGGTVLADLADAMTARRIAVSMVGSAPDGAPQAYRLDGDTIHATVMVDIRGAPGAAAVSMLATPGGPS